MIQILEARHRHHFGRDSSLGRRDASAQAENGERPVYRFQQRRAFVAPHPMGNFDARRNHVREPVGLHLRGGPGHGFLQPRGTAQAIANTVAEIRQLVHAALIGQRCVDEFGSRIAVLFGQRARVLREERSRERGAGYEYDSALVHHAPAYHALSPVMNRKPCSCMMRRACSAASGKT